MQSWAALFPGDTWMMSLPVLLFLWRKKRKPDEQGRGHRLRKEQPAAWGSWLYVGKDEDGTPFYLDTENLSYESENGLRVRMWVKYRPRKGSAACVNAESFLQAAGKAREPFDHIRQELEIDFSKNVVGDLELVFHAADGRVIDSVVYTAPEWKKITPGSVYELLQKTADGTWKPDRFHPDPELRAKLQEKLKEINEAFEAFETAGS